ncbi:unnamed protein product [Aphanomyces euteiches]|uniref:Ribosomal protein S21 n=1 Tax=Aphanomyces euteiches TaxID=100861 RepID=A0A6G0XWH1_9STRA|nr:hypothetical protein Ae201684_000643 [Aphanomyces euteiches]KAH9091793.1 hypothetical protein Ae201684P_011337 [Aphanomyces euteiches]KAH9099126.1 hypothetical protein LEN26_016313 [Aphanomyces euteiches]KAH9103460.1 hypothetical protein AeMF1_020194 [Aphanomyces euteiches]KAH9117736.1 hypothetical protein AeMF1_008743 [Aphanomyces euteiches]
MLQQFVRRAVTPAVKNTQSRSLWYHVGYNEDADYVLKDLHRSMQDDGSIKQLDQRAMHEKKWQRRIRKKAESDIRNVNKRMGTIIDFCLAKQKQGSL